MLELVSETTLSAAACMFCFAASWLPNTFSAAAFTVCFVLVDMAHAT